MKLGPLMRLLPFALGGFICFSQHASAKTASQSVDLSTGSLDVNYAAYLSKHDVVFNRPIDNPAEGSTVGNGRVGAMVWNKDGLNLQVTGIDASEQTAFSAGWVTLRTTPAMDTSYGKFQQRLSLYDGVLTTRYDSDRVVTIMASPNSEVLGIHVRDSRRNVSQVTLDLSLWEVKTIGGGDVPNIDTWRSVTTYADNRGIGLSRGQRDPNNFGYTLAASVQGAAFVARSVDANTVRLVITPSAEYTIWIACASRLNAPHHDSISQAAALLNKVETQGYALTLSDYESWWHSFWEKSFVQYSPKSDGGYLENLYYLYTYIIAAGSYGNYPMHFINGDFKANGDDDSTRWSVAYWHWNQRDIYESFLTSNHPDIFRALTGLYSRNIGVLTAYTRQKYAIDGLWVPETMGWNGSARYTDGSDWTKEVLSTGAEVAENLYAEYKYSNDTNYLLSSVYPFARQVAQFYANRLTHDPATGRYSMAKSNALETFWRVDNAITDLAAIRSLLSITIKASLALGVDTDLRKNWGRILENLAPYPLNPDGSQYAPHDPPAAESHNGQNVACELLWPYGVSGIGASDYEIALHTWQHRPHPYGDIWSNDAVQAARLGLGDEVLRGAETLIETYQSYPNGLTNNTNGRFEYLGTHLLALNESLLQSYNDRIRVFPAVPTSPAFVGRFTLMASGGFLVTSEYAEREIKYVTLKSLYGNRVTLVNPWGGERVRVKAINVASALITTTQAEFAFDTVPGAVYLIERTSRPLSYWAHTQLTGTRNNDEKRLSASTSLGSAATLRAAELPK